MQIDITTAPTGPDAPVVSTRPDNVPEKFWDASTNTVKTDDLIKSYAALETKLGAPKGDELAAALEAEAEANAEANAAADEVTDEQVDDVVAEGNLDVDAIEAQWLSDKTIPEAELEKMAKIGVTKEMAEEFIAYREAQADRIRDEITGSVGGEEAVNKMVEWAGSNYTAEKAEAFNKAVNSKDKGQIEMALKSLKADFEKVNGKVPKLVKPTSAAVPRGDRYESLNQMLKDQRDPRYASDPAFRNAVIAKVGRSNI